MRVRNREIGTVFILLGIGIFTTADAFGGKDDQLKKLQEVQSLNCVAVRTEEIRVLVQQYKDNQGRPSTPTNGDTFAAAKRIARAICQPQKKTLIGEELDRLAVSLTDYPPVTTLNPRAPQQDAGKMELLQRIEKLKKSGYSGSGAKKAKSKTVQIGGTVSAEDGTLVVGGKHWGAMLGDIFIDLNSPWLSPLFEEAAKLKSKDDMTELQKADYLAKLIPSAAIARSEYSCPLLKGMLERSRQDRVIPLSEFVLAGVGDCRSHAYLLAALCKEAGIEAEAANFQVVHKQRRGRKDISEETNEEHTVVIVTVPANGVQPAGKFVIDSYLPHLSGRPLALCRRPVGHVDGRGAVKLTERKSYPAFWVKQTGQSDECIFDLDEEVSLIGEAMSDRQTTVRVTSEGDSGSSFNSSVVTAK